MCGSDLCPNNIKLNPISVEIPRKVFLFVEINETHDLNRCPVCGRLHTKGGEPFWHSRKVLNKKMVEPLWVDPDGKIMLKPANY